MKCNHCTTSGDSVKCVPSGWAVIYNPYCGINEPLDKICEIGFRDNILKHFTHPENYYYWMDSFPEYEDRYPPMIVYVHEELKERFTNVDSDSESDSEPDEKSL